MCVNDIPKVHYVTANDQELDCESEYIKNYGVSQKHATIHLFITLTSVGSFTTELSKNLANVSFSPTLRNIKYQNSKMLVYLTQQCRFTSNFHKINKTMQVGDIEQTKC